MYEEIIPTQHPYHDPFPNTNYVLCCRFIIYSYVRMCVYILTYDCVYVYENKLLWRVLFTHNYLIICFPMKSLINFIIMMILQKNKWKLV